MKEGRDTLHLNAKQMFDKNQCNIAEALVYIIHVALKVAPNALNTVHRCILCRMPSEGQEAILRQKMKEKFWCERGLFLLNA